MAINLGLFFELNGKREEILGWFTPFSRQWRKVFDQIIHEVEPEIKASNKQEGIIRFQNGCQIKFFTGENLETIRGETFDYVIIDEAQDISEEIWVPLLPACNVKFKKGVIIGTPKGKSWFYDWFNKGLDKKQPFFSSYKAISTDNPYFDETQIEISREMFSEDTIQNEYFAVFNDSAGVVFNNIERASIVGAWNQKRGKKAYIGCDIALGGKDKTVIVAMNPTGRVLEVQRWSESNTETQIQKIIAFCDKYRVVGGHIETNTERGIWQAVNRRYKKIRSFFTTDVSKAEAVQMLKRDIEQIEVELPSLGLDKELHTQLRSYEYKQGKRAVLYSHPQGGNDDSVDALWLANHARRTQKMSAPRVAQLNKY